jgi:ABC-2 type transport system ATP-binding protein
MFSRYPALEVERLTKEFKTVKGLVRAVNEVSFSLAEGEVLGLLGPNGAGKSTTIQMLLGMLTPTSGRIAYFGRDFAAHRSEVLERVGYASGYSRFPWNLTTGEALDVAGRLYGLGKAERAERIEKLLKHFRIFHLRDRTNGGHSAGENTRIMLVKAFLGAPEILLLDEPTASLDPDICSEVRAFIKDGQRGRRSSMVYTSHNMAEVAELCDRVVFMRAGRVVAQDTPSKLAARIASVSLRLKCTARERRIIEFFTETGITARLEAPWVEASVAHDRVGTVLANLVGKGIVFEDIEVRKPTLEDFFLHVAKGGDV